MNIFNLLQFLLYFHVADVYCHGDHEDKSKLLLVYIKLQNSTNIYENISSKFNISLPLKLFSINSIADGCYQANASKCEPVWASNQRNHFESALLGWPNNIFNDSMWPSFSVGCDSLFIPINMKFDKLINWMKRPKATLVMMSTNINYPRTLNDFINNLIIQFVELNEMNLIIIAHSTFYAIGPKFRPKHDPLTYIQDIDIKNIIVEILELKMYNLHSDGNKTVAKILTIPPSHHRESRMFEIIFISVIITVSAVIGSLFIIEAIKNACNKKQKMNHHYNLGLNDISKFTGYPEKTYLLSVSDEDELFNDAIQPHIQTTPTTPSK